MSFTEKKFEFDHAALAGISAKTIEEHLKLYAGYVKHANLILEKIKTLSENAQDNAFAIGELQRRFGFEFGGIRNHEYYFEQFEGGAVKADPNSKLSKKIESTWGSYDQAIAQFKSLAMTRGIGWAFMYYDPQTDQLLHAWVDEQHLGHLTGLKVIIALDMWEHSYMLDYVPSEKKKYVDAFFDNANASVFEKRFDDAVQG